MSRNVPAIECKPVVTEDKDGNMIMIAFDRDEINKPGAYRVGMGVKTPGAAPVQITNVCCPCGCGVHTSAWEAPAGAPASMKSKIAFDYPGHAKWEGQLLNGVWTEEDDPKVPQTKAA